MAMYQRFDCPLKASEWPRLRGSFSRVVVWSDLHTDKPDNMQQVLELPAQKDAVLLLPGDVVKRKTSCEDGGPLVYQLGSVPNDVQRRQPAWLS
eukprot:3064026-Amphidinium_carterae.1